MYTTALAVGLGAALGALVRWRLGVLLDPFFSHIALGTLTVNLVGGYCIGFVACALMVLPQLVPEWRLFLVTGFLGGMTTFSAFSLELASFMQAQRWGYAMALMVLHVGGSCLMVFAGMGTCLLVRRCLA